jgi:glyoxylase-like metal-dependent hydrolase (beta-lactamase superfamily II)
MEHDLIQLFDVESSTFTYFLVDRATREAMAIDSVDRQVERDLGLIKRLDLKLRYALETHAHADHITGAARLVAATGALSAAPSGCGILPANVQMQDGDVLLFGVAEQLRALHTPGHTAGSMSFAWRGNVFTGDALLIDGCGRTDFQGGDARTLYDSIHAKLFTLPDITRVYPAHDYRGNAVSTIGWEKRHNARLANRSRADFIDLMAHLNLPRPKMMDVAVPANRNLGVIPHAA